MFSVFAWCVCFEQHEYWIHKNIPFRLNERIKDCENSDLIGCFGSFWVFLFLDSIFGKLRSFVVKIHWFYFSLIWQIIWCRDPLFCPLQWPAHATLSLSPICLYSPPFPWSWPCVRFPSLRPTTLITSIKLQKYKTPFVQFKIPSLTDCSTSCAVLPLTWSAATDIGSMRFHLCSDLLMQLSHYHQCHLPPQIIVLIIHPQSTALS